MKGCAIADIKDLDVVKKTKVRQKRVDKLFTTFFKGPPSKRRESIFLFKKRNNNKWGKRGPSQYSL